MKECIVAFCGSIASGKTSIALEVSKALNWGYGSFGNFIRKEAANRGLDNSSRSVLQEIGTELILEGWHTFCKNVLKDANWTQGRGLVVDGVRHLDCLLTIQEIVKPMKVILVYVDIDRIERSERLRRRGVSQEEILFLEQHETEQHLDELRIKANFEINGNQPVEQIRIDIECFLNNSL